MNRRLSDNRCFCIDVLSAIHEILQVLRIRRLRCVRQSLQDIARVLVFGHREGVFGVGGGLRVGAQSGEKTRRLEVALERRHMKWRMIVLVPMSEHVFEQFFHLLLEVTLYHHVVTLAKEVLEFR